jgi:hypothetical protein
VEGLKVPIGERSSLVSFHGMVLVCPGNIPGNRLNLLNTEVSQSRGHATESVRLAVILFQSARACPTT